MSTLTAVLWTIPSCVRHGVAYEWAVFDAGDRLLGTVPSSHDEREVAEIDDDERLAALALFQKETK